MTEATLPRYRYWGDRKPNARLAKVQMSTFMDTFLDVMNGDSDTAPEQVGLDENPTVAVFRLYAPIDSWGGWWGISAEEVSAALDKLPSSVTTLIIRINSPGGEVPDALAILNMFRAHRAKTIAVVDGWAVSAASFIACGCDETVMSPGTEAMIHDARIFAYGDPAALRKMADRMDTSSNGVAAIYADKAGKDEAYWRTVMGPETWFTAKEFVEAGLADRVAVVPDAGMTDTPGTDEPEVDETGLEGDAPENVFDLSMYRYAGRNQAPAPAAAIAPPTKPPTASADGITPPEGGTDMSFIDDVRTKLGVAKDADEATITAALDEALNERAEDTPPSSTNALKDGQIAVSKAEWEEMRGDAQRGSAAATELHEMRRTAALDRLKDRFLPTNRQAWEKEYDLNPKATIEALEKRPVVIPLDELGHSVDEDTNGPAKTVNDVREDANYKTWEV